MFILNDLPIYTIISYFVLKLTFSFKIIMKLLKLSCDIIGSLFMLLSLFITLVTKHNEVNLS